MACVARAYDDNLLSSYVAMGCCSGRSSNLRQRSQGRVLPVWEGFGGACCPAQGVCDGLPLAWGYGFRFIYVADDGHHHKFRSVPGSSGRFDDGC